MSIRNMIVSRIKKTLQIWVAVYPAVLVVLTLLGDSLQEWPLPVRVLGATAIIVPIVANITEPAVRFAVAAIAQRVGRQE